MDSDINIATTQLVGHIIGHLHEAGDDVEGIARIGREVAELPKGALTHLALVTLVLLEKQIAWSAEQLNMSWEEYARHMAGMAEDFDGG